MRAISAVVGLAVLLAAATAAQDSGRAKPSLLEASFSKLPIYFIENRCVYPDDVAYYVQGADKTLLFTKEGITFRLKGKDQGWVVKLAFLGANPDVKPRGEDRQVAVFSYFQGPEKEWKTGLRTYGRVIYQDLWPGIDLVYKGNVNRLKYEFVVKPGADPAMIRLGYRGATEIEVTQRGGLRVETPAGRFEDEPPLAWQLIEGRKRPIEVEYDLSEGAGEFAFRVGDYDRTAPLVLDPALLIYCGYIGGGSHEEGFDIALDASGNAYVAGATYSDEKTLPVRVGPDPTLNGVLDAFVAKVNAQGTALVYCGYLGGSNDDLGLGIAVDAQGNAYVSGSTSSDAKTFPVKVGPYLTFKGGSAGQPLDAFVAKVSANGAGLVYCGYIGGTANDSAWDVAVDASGSAYVTGTTASDQSTFPVKVGPDLTYNGARRWGDVYVAKVHPQGSGLVYCGYIGGATDDLAGAIALDVSGNAYVCGYTDSDEKSFPVTVGPDLKYHGRIDAFVAKVNSRGSALVYCGYVGGIGDDYGFSIAVDTSGRAYLSGMTSSDETTFPVRVGPDLTYNGAVAPVGDAFISRVAASGRNLEYCGYIGGANDESGDGIAVDTAGNAYVTGWTSSTEKSFPVIVGPDLTMNGGYQDAFVAKVNASGGRLDYCGYIGGSGSDHCRGIAVDGSGAAYVTGGTTSDQKTFPVVVGPGLTHGNPSAPSASEDAFVAKISLNCLFGTGTPRPGGVINLALTAHDDAGLPYQVASSLGLGPIPLDTRRIALSPDLLLGVTVGGLWPSVFSGYRGVLDWKAQAQATIHIPNLPALIGVRLHSAFVTLDPAAPSGIRSISNTFSFSVAK